MRTIESNLITFTDDPPITAKELEVMRRRAERVRLRVMHNRTLDLDPEKRPQPGSRGTASAAAEGAS